MVCWKYSFRGAAREGCPATSQPPAPHLRRTRGERTLRAFGSNEPQRHRGHREDKGREDQGRLKNEERRMEKEEAARAGNLPAPAGHGSFFTFRSSFFLSLCWSSLCPRCLGGSVLLDTLSFAPFGPTASCVPFSRSPGSTARWPGNEALRPRRQPVCRHRQLSHPPNDPGRRQRSRRRRPGPRWLATTNVTTRALRVLNRVYISDMRTLTFPVHREIIPAGQLNL
jgi:hypothetical protein